jgi:AcrR family transcriptional regulator
VKPLRRSDRGPSGPRWPLDRAQPAGNKLPRGPHHLPREFVAHSQRSRLLDGIAYAVARKGYAATTVQDVLTRAGVSRKTFYEHFADKEDCFLAAYETVTDHMMTRLVARYEQSGPWSKRVRGVLCEFVHFLVAEPDFAHMCIVDVLAAGPQALERRDAVMRSFIPLVDAVRDHLDDPQAVPPVAAEAVIGGIYEVIYTRIVRGDTDALEGLVEQLVYMCVAPFLGHDQASSAMQTPG